MLNSMILIFLLSFTAFSALKADEISDACYGLCKKDERTEVYAYETGRYDQLTYCKQFTQRNWFKSLVEQGPIYEVDLPSNAGQYIAPKGFFFQGNDGIYIHYDMNKPTLVERFNATIVSYSYSENKLSYHDKKSGEKSFSFSAKIVKTIRLKGNRVLVVCRNTDNIATHLYCYDLITHQVVWHSLSYYKSMSVSLLDGCMFTIVGQSRIAKEKHHLVLSAESGELRWIKKTTNTSIRQLKANNSYVIFGVKDILYVNSLLPSPKHAGYSISIATWKVVYMVDKSVIVEQVNKRGGLICDFYILHKDNLQLSHSKHFNSKSGHYKSGVINKNYFFIDEENKFLCYKLGSKNIKNPSSIPIEIDSRLTLSEVYQTKFNEKLYFFFQSSEEQVNDIIISYNIVKQKWRYVKKFSQTPIKNQPDRIKIELGLIKNQPVQGYPEYNYNLLYLSYLYNITGFF